MRKMTRRDYVYTHLGTTVLFAGLIGISALLPLSFGTELTTDAKVTDRHLEFVNGNGPVVVMPCFGPPDEILDVGGQRVLHYRRTPSGERLHACLNTTATDEMYVLMNGQGIVKELLLTKNAGSRTTQATHLP